MFQTLEGGKQNGSRMCSEIFFRLASLAVDPGEVAVELT